MHVASPPPAQRAAGFDTQPSPATGPRIRARSHRRPHPVRAVREQPRVATPPAGVLPNGSQPSSLVPNTWQSGMRKANLPEVPYVDK